MLHRVKGKRYLTLKKKKKKSKFRGGKDHCEAIAKQIKSTVVSNRETTDNPESSQIIPGTNRDKYLETEAQVGTVRNLKSEGAGCGVWCEPM